MNKEQLKMIANQQPIVTIHSASTALKGQSYCKFCEASGYFSVSEGREWDHKENCPWVAANKLLKQ